MGEEYSIGRFDFMSPDSRQERACRNCDALPRVRVSHAESHRLPASWRPIDEHPDLRPGPWVPRGDMKGVVFCEACDTLWLLFLDPAQDYYTDVIEMAPELSALVSDEASLQEILPLAESSDSLLQLMIRDWFALADYDASDAVEALVAGLGQEDLSTGLAVRLLDFLAAVLAGAGRGRRVSLIDAAPLVGLLERDDFLSLDEVRRASELHELRRLLSGIARAAFGTAFGADHDRLEASPAARDALLAMVSAGENERPVLAPPGVVPSAQLHRERFDAAERLVSEIEDLLREGVSRVTPQEIAPIVEVVRAFWENERALTPRWEPGISLYRRCRDVLLALRHAELVPEESERDVEEALASS